MFLYETCTGTLYETEEELSYEDLQCEICGDSHSFIGEFQTEEEKKLLISNIY